MSDGLRFVAGDPSVVSAHDHDDWLLVARSINPDITDDEFEAQWKEFLALKAEHDRRRALN